MADELAKTPLSEILEAASRIEGVDIDLALGRIGRKQKVLEAAMEQTANAMEEKTRTMEHYLSAEDLRGFAIEAHGLKNALTGIGAVNLSVLAGELETAAKNGKAALCKDKFVPFADSAIHFALTLKAVFPQAAREAQCTGDSLLLAQAIKDSVTCLNAFEADDALACLGKLEAYTYGEEVDALLRHIRNKIKAFKYDEASLLLKSLLY